MKKTPLDNGASSYRRFLDGDKNAFDDIMSEHFYKLVLFIDRYVGDIHQAEDIAMDVFVYLIVHRHRYNFKTNFKTYLYMLAASRAIDYIRHDRVLATQPLDDCNAATERDELFDAVFEGERKKALYDAISALPEEMRAAVYLVYFEGMSYDAAAEVMHMSRKKVDNLLYRAKQKLCELLGNDGEKWL